MVGFLAQAGASAQAALLERLPPVGTPAFANLAPLREQLDALKSDPALGPQLEGSLPDLAAYLQSPEPSSMQGGALPDDLLAKLQGADATTIVDLTKEVAGRMYDQHAPDVVRKIRDGLASGLSGLDGALAGLRAEAADLARAIDAGGPQVDALRAAAVGLSSAIARLETLRGTMAALADEVPGAFAAYRTEYLASIEADRAEIEQTFQDALDGGFRNMFLLVSASTVLAFLVLLFYREKKRTGSPAAPTAGDGASAS
jgi:hypothetical protein